MISVSSLMTNCIFVILPMFYYYKTYFVLFVCCTIVTLKSGIPVYVLCVSSKQAKGYNRSPALDPGLSTRSTAAIYSSLVTS